jgi:hypothetical protein
MTGQLTPTERKNWLSLSKTEIFILGRREQMVRKEYECKNRTGW